MDETQAERVAIVATEACTNLLKHAAGGEILLRNTGTDDPNGLSELEILALDHGPGMANLEQCLRDGFSTGGSPGQGLGAIVRLSAESDLYSDPGRGTAVLARWSAGSNGNGNGHGSGTKLRIGAVNVSQAWSGSLRRFVGSRADRRATASSWWPMAWATVWKPGCLVGSGPHAAREPGSRAAANCSNGLIRRCAVRAGRPSAWRASIWSGAYVTFAGVGNISAQIYSGAKASQHLVSVNGTAGHQMHRIREFSYPWPDDGMLVMHSDGLSTNAGLETHSGLALHDPSLIAGVLYRDFSRGNDDATVVVAKAA